MHTRARGFVTRPPEKVTFSREKVVFTILKVTFSSLKVTLLHINMRIIMHSWGKGKEQGARSQRNVRWRHTQRGIRRQRAVSTRYFQSMTLTWRRRRMARTMDCATASGCSIMG